MFEAIHLDTLDNLFKGHPVGKTLEFKNISCIRCGRPVSIEIQKTSAGYGFLNGMLSEPNEDRHSAQCAECGAKKS